MKIKTVENINPGFGKKKQDKIEQASTFINMNDSQLRYLAYVNSEDERTERKQQHSLNRTFWAMPIVDTIASGLLVRGINGEGELSKLEETALSSRVKAVGDTAAIWALGLSAIGIYNVAKNAVVSNSPSLKRFNRDNPVMSFFVDLGIIAGSFILGLKGLGKLINNHYEKHPEKVLETEGRIANLSEKIDTSKFNTKIMPKIIDKVSKFEERFPNLSNAGKFALANSVFILLGISILKMIKFSADKQKRIEHNYNQIKAAQFETAKYLVNSLGIEDDVLKQDKSNLAKDLRREMNKTEPIQE